MRFGPLIVRLLLLLALCYTAYGNVFTLTRIVTGVRIDSFYPETTMNGTVTLFGTLSCHGLS